ncbi:MAG: hypothetical protein ABSE73_28275 [Planctomycetota bacterium]
MTDAIPTWFCNDQWFEGVERLLPSDFAAADAAEGLCEHFRSDTLACDKEEAREWQSDIGTAL